MFKRFRKDDLPLSLLVQIETGMKYLWEQDLLKKSEIESFKYAQVPFIMREALVVDYLFYGLFKTNSRIFSDIMHHKEVLYDIATGLIPRFFDANPRSFDDSIIWDENEQVSELYFIQQGTIRIGFAVISSGLLG